MEIAVHILRCALTGNLVAAFARERQLKGWSRARKEALITHACERLPALSRSSRGDQA